MEKKFIPYGNERSIFDTVEKVINNFEVSNTQMEKNINLAVYILERLKLSFKYSSINNKHCDVYEFLLSMINVDSRNNDTIANHVNITKEDIQNIFECFIADSINSFNMYFEKKYNCQAQQPQQQEQQQQPIVTEASAANYSVGDIVNKFIPVQSSAPQTIELTDAQKAEFIMHSDVFKNSVKLDSKINAEVSPQQVLNIWEIIHCDAFKNYLHTKGIPINVSYKQVVNDHDDPNLNMKFEIIGSNGNVLYIGDGRKYIII